MLQIKKIDEFTDEFILNIDETLFIQTIAYNTFQTKQLFISKIHDKTIRFKMITNILYI